MLIPYKKEYEKIAMGLLSFMPDGKSVHNIRKIIDYYRESESLKLYLWKNKAGRFTGVAGVEKTEKGICLKDLTVDPSFRNEGLGHTIVKALEELYSEKLYGTKQTEAFLHRCDHKSGNKKNGEGES